MLNRALTLRKALLRILDRLQPVPPLVARLVLGWIFVRSGWGKLHNLPQVIEFFAGLGIPAPQLQAPMVSGVELLCGGMVLVGLLARLSAVPLLGTMVVALLTAQRDQVHTLGDLFQTVEFLYLSLLLWLSVAGPGRLSLDALVAARLDRARGYGQGALHQVAVA